MEKLSKQEIERHYFKKFVASDKYKLPKCEVIFGDRPDVIIKGQRKVGIEITNLYKACGKDKKSEQQQREIRKKVLREAKRRFEKGGGKPMNIQFTFRLPIPINGKRDQEITDKIVLLASKIASLAKRSEFGEVPWCLLMDIPELSSVLFSVLSDDDPQWTECNAYDAPDVSIPRLKEIVKGKEKKVKGYDSCDAYWLLVVIDIWDPAQDQRIGADGLKILSKKFERILIYENGRNQVVEVATS